MAYAMTRRRRASRNLGDRRHTTQHKKYYRTGTLNHKYSTKKQLSPTTLSSARLISEGTINTMYSSYYGQSSNTNTNSNGNAAEVSTKGMAFNPQTSQWEKPSYVAQTSSVNSYYGAGTNNGAYHNPSAVDLRSIVATGTQPPVPENPVAVYTAYYNGWNEIVEGKKPPPPGLNHEWAKYYADSASRAAHHFYQNPNIRSAPFELPPAPPGVDTNGNVTSSQPIHSSYQSQQSGNAYQRHQYQHQFNPSGAQSISKKLTYQQYMEKSLAQCRTDAERREMDQKLIRVIQDAVANGSLQKDWSSEPLLEVPRDPRRIASTYGSTTSSSSSPYSPYGTQPNSQSPMNSYQHNRQNNMNGQDSKQNHFSSANRDSQDSASASYYGPSSGMSSSPSHGKRTSPKNNSRTQPFNVSKSSSSHQTQKVDPNDAYYGPSISYSTGNQYKQQPKKKKFKRDTGFDTSKNALSDRAQRFASSFATTQSFDEVDELQPSGPIIQGRCQVLEKEYLRLTSAPKPELVRPESIMKQHLKNLLAERLKVDTRRDYLWFCSQLKAIRQDLTVQHIRNSFTVHVYETHAHIALEEGDLNEFNQCQTQLKYFYDYLRSQSSSSETKDEDKADALLALKNQNEFVAYRLLYSVLLTQNEKYTGGSSDLLNLLQSLSKEQQEHPSICFANEIRSAVAEGNNHKFFAWLRKSKETKSTEAGGVDSHGSYLLERIAPAMRKQALPLLIRAYRPLTLQVDFALTELGCDGDKDFGKKWMKSCGCVFSPDGSEILCKETTIRESDLEEKSSLI